MNSCLMSSPDRPRECVGEGVKACRAHLQHEPNVAMTGCIADELAYWTKQLDIEQASQLARAAKFETDRARIGASYGGLIDMTRNAKKTWVNHRDAACNVEVSYWTGGTGGASVLARCKLEMTAKQAVSLKHGAGWGASL